MSVFHLLPFSEDLSMKIAQHHDEWKDSHGLLNSWADKERAPVVWTKEIGGETVLAIKYSLICVNPAFFLIEYVVDPKTEKFSLYGYFSQSE